MSCGWFCGSCRSGRKLGNVVVKVKKMLTRALGDDYPLFYRKTGIYCFLQWLEIRYIHLQREFLKGWLSDTNLSSVTLQLALWAALQSCPWFVYSPTTSYLRLGGDAGKIAVPAGSTCTVGNGLSASVEAFKLPFYWSRSSLLWRQQSVSEWLCFRLYADCIFFQNYPGSKKRSDKISAEEI